MNSLKGYFIKNSGAIQKEAEISSAVIFNRSLALTALVLGLHWLTLLIAPFESDYPTVPAIVILWVFFAIFFACARLVLAGCNIAWMDRSAARITPDVVFQDRRLHAFLVLVSLVGVILHVWTKYYLTQLHPVSCLSGIRFAWMAVDRSALPLHIRIGSVLGHLLTSFAYLGIMAASFNIVRSGATGAIKRRDQILQLFFVIVGVLYAGFIGSRNAMLAFLAMSLVGTLLGSTYCGRPTQLHRQFRGFVSGLLLPAIVMVTFSSLIFSDRIFCNSSNSLELSEKQINESYLEGFRREFALSPIAHEDQLDWRSFAGNCSICGPAMIYVNHGIYNLSKIMASDARGDPILFKFVSSWLGRLGLISTPMGGGGVEKRVYGPGGTSLAGAAYHDFGAAGLAVTAAVLGGLFGASIRMMRANGAIALAGLWLFSCLFYVLLISNMFVGFSVLPFPFLAFGVGCGLAAWFAINNRRSTAHH